MNPGSKDVQGLFGRNHPEYRPDIDGLRAIAVLSVVMYHAYPRWVNGGFVGVDVFFVISGFLISSIIFKGLDDGKFSFIDFYIRRVKRIFPALILVLSVCLSFGWALLFVDEYKTLGKQAAAGAGFIANFILLREGGYFATASELKPMLHLWSLGIEEQFYLVWPLLVWALWRWPVVLSQMVLSLAIASFLANLLIVGTNPEAAFYLPFTRFWELMLGALLAHRRFEPRPSSSGGIDTSSSVMSLLGLLLIAGATLIYDDHTNYPGAWALAPTLGSVLVIAAGPRAYVNRRVLGNRWLVSLGLISYPIYLWHWPALYFLRIAKGQNPTDEATFTAILLSFALSWLTFRYFEAPIRRSWESGLALASSLCAALFVLMVIGVAAYKTWIPLRFPEAWQMIAAARQDHEGPRSWDADKVLKPSFLGDQDHPEILFLGDSHMEHYYPRIRRIMTQMTPRENGVAFATAGGCPPIPGIDRIDVPGPIGCDDFFRQSIDYATRSGIKKLVLSAYWDRYFIGIVDNKNSRPVLYRTTDLQRRPILPHSLDYTSVFADLEHELVALTSRGVKLYIVLPNPAADAMAPSKMLDQFNRLYWGDFPIPDVPSISSEKMESFLKPIVDELRELAQRTGATVIDPFPHICGVRGCTATVGGYPVNGDADHLTGTFASNHASYIDVVFDFQKDQHVASTADAN